LAVGVQPQTPLEEPPLEEPPLEELMTLPKPLVG